MKWTNSLNDIKYQSLVKKKQISLIALGQLKNWICGLKTVHKKNCGADGFPSVFYQMFRRETIQILCKLSQKIKREGNAFQPITWCQHCHDPDTREWHRWKSANQHLSDTQLQNSRQNVSTSNPTMYNTSWSSGISPKTSKNQCKFWRSVAQWCE